MEFLIEKVLTNDGKKSMLSVKDILIICADSLSGIKEAIAAAFPKTEYQSCIVHQVRNAGMITGIRSRQFSSSHRMSERLFTRPIQSKV